MERLKSISGNSRAARVSSAAGGAPQGLALGSVSVSPSSQAKSEAFALMQVRIQVRQLKC